MSERTVDTMPIAFTCPFCDRKYRVDDGLAGRKVKCKECGTDLTVPSAGISSTAPPPKPAPAADLYGLNDASEDEAVLPAPKRAGLVAEASATTAGRRRRQRGSSHGEPHEGLRQAGFTMLFLGGLSFVLPMAGLQLKGLHLLPPEVQAGFGVVMLMIGAFCLVASLTGVLAAIGAAAALGCVLFLVAKGVFFQRQNAGIPPGAGPVANLPPNNFPPNNRPPNLGPPPDAPLAAAALPAKIHITLSNGRSSPRLSPLGAPLPGVEFQAEYQRNGPQPPEILKYQTVITSRAGNATDHFAIVKDSGEIGGSVISFSQHDGPFEMHIEADVSTPTGIQQQRVSQSIPLPWVNAERPQNAPQPGAAPPGFPNPGAMPGQPGFGPPGFPNRPPGLPTGPPGMPNRGRLPGFGPRPR